MFIPKKIIKVGSRVELTENVENCSGMFTVGHVFTVKEMGSGRGFDLEDDDGRMLRECYQVKLLDENSKVRIGYFREDTCCHTLFIPEHLVEEYDKLMDQLNRTPTPENEEEYYELEGQFCQKFDGYIIDDREMFINKIAILS